MSTRAAIHFQYKGETEAIIYRHSDGYPEGLGEDLKQFLSDVKEQLADTRFGNPAYLAAKYVVWQAGQYQNSKEPLDFLGIGVMVKDPGDIGYRYLLECSNGKTPNITIESAH